jgi:hypothetical protein
MIVDVFQVEGITIQRIGDLFLHWRSIGAGCNNIHHIRRAYRRGEARVRWIYGPVPVRQTECRCSALIPRLGSAGVLASDPLDGGVEDLLNDRECQSTNL